MVGLALMSSAGCGATQHRQPATNPHDAQADAATRDATATDAAHDSALRDTATSVANTRDVASADTQIDGADTGAVVDVGAPPSSPPPLGGAAPRTVFYLGHSLIGEWMPNMVQDFAATRSLTQTFQFQIGIGANLAFQRDDNGRPQGVIAKRVLPATAFDVFLLTEAVPLESQMQWSDTIGNANRYLGEARQGNRNVQTYVYESWDHRTGTVAAWRNQIAADRTRWNQIVDTLNQRSPGSRQVLLIPAASALSVLSQEIEARRVPGLTNITQLFTDDVHPNSQGFYFVACVVYAALYRQSPEGLTTSVNGPGGTGSNGAYTPPPSASVASLQRIAWDVVRQDSRSGLQ